MDLKYHLLIFQLNSYNDLHHLQVRLLVDQMKLLLLHHLLVSSGDPLNLIEARVAESVATETDVDK